GVAQCVRAATDTRSAIATLSALSALLAALLTSLLNSLLTLAAGIAGLLVTLALTTLPLLTLALLTIALRTLPRLSLLSSLGNLLARLLRIWLLASLLTLAARLTALAHALFLLLLLQLSGQLLSQLLGAGQLLAHLRHRDVFITAVAGLGTSLQGLHLLHQLGRVARRLLNGIGRRRSAAGGHRLQVRLELCQILAYLLLQIHRQIHHAI